MHHHNEEDAWWNNIPYEIECKGEIECYDKINEFHPKYPLIIYSYARRYKQRLKKIVSIIKKKSLIGDINNDRMIFIIL
ncbi:MAG: hypothetical protein QOK67_09820 [Nitrososphaeraceae archaeon]|nr:hypothetical protein [Nitrososphaeraceae archaeon]